MPSRRAVIFGGGAALLAAAGAREQDRLRRVLEGHPSSPHPVPSSQAGTVLSGSFRSAAMDATTGWSLAYPAGFSPSARLPLLLVLHGRGSDHRHAFDSLHLDRFLSAAVTSGARPFTIASVDGGDHSYWHARRSGVDPQSMILDELLPLLATRGVDVTRLALGGWSMGGYGALLLAQRLGPGRVTCLAVDSPALWSRWEESAKGAFDGPTDFAAHDVLASSSRLAGMPVRVSCGTSDPFLPGVRRLLRSLPSAEHDLARGGHDVAWWQHAAPAQLSFVAAHLVAPPAANASGSFPTIVSDVTARVMAT